ncbi:MAG: recombinase family protein [Actinomycetota bacterium]
MRAAGYVRVSSARQATEGLSLGEQESSIRAYVESQDWELTELFTDAGVSGRLTSRPSLDRLLATLPEIDRIVVVSLDRLGRNAAGMLELYDRLEAAEVELVALRQNIDTSNASGRMSRDLLTVLAKFETEQLGERVAATAEARAASGKHHGKPCYGYRSNGGELELVPVEVEIVRRIYKESAAGRSQRKIAKGLNDAGIRAKQTRRWSPASVGAILRNVTYRGAIPWGDEEFDGIHEAIIKPALWRKVEAGRKANARTEKGGPGRLPAGPQIFNHGLLRCAHCGEAMMPRSDKRDDRFDYRCAGREKNGVDFCPQKPIPAAPLDAATFAYFREVGLDLEATRKLLTEAVEEERRRVEDALDQAEREEGKAAEAVARIRAEYKSGALPVAEWLSLKPELEAEHAAAQAALAELRRRETEVAEAGEQTAEVENAAVLRLANIRAAIAGEVTDAEGIDAVRHALRSTFEAFYVARLHPSTELSDWVPESKKAAAEAARFELAPEVSEAFAAKQGADAFMVEGDGWRVLPVPKPEVVEGVDAMYRPVLRREGLKLPTIDGLAQEK